MNFKFLPFVIGMALASTAANAADGSFTNLTVSNNATVSNKLNVSGISTFNKTANFKNLVNITLAKGANNNFIECSDLNKSAYNTMFYVTNYGYAFATGFVVRETAANHCCSPALHIDYDTPNSRFNIDTESYMGRFHPIYLKASSFTFDGGDMVVNGKITCKEEMNVVALNAKNINVEMNNAADYVFDENYNLKSLSEVENYVNEHKHLPGIPSAADMAENGMNVSTMSNLLLEKVEELTLHMIRLEKENAALKAEVKSLKK